jgi:hypothetical protein
MKIVARAAMGLALLGSVAAAQPAEVSAQGGGASGIAQFCKEIVGQPGFFTFETTGECVSTIATLANPGKAEGVGFCKLIFSQLDIPQRFFGQCVRQVQGGGGQ